MLKKSIRTLLSLFLVASLALAAKNLWALTQNPAVSYLTQRTSDDLSASLNKSLNRTATSQTLEQKLSELLLEDPRNWIVIESIQDIAQAQDIALSQVTIDTLDQTYAADHSIFETTSKCLSCGWDPKACEISAVLLCRAPVDLTPIGDVGGVLRESANYVSGNPVDKIDLTLSAIGLGATVVAPMTGGTSLSIKLGATALKTTKKLGNLSPNLTKLLIKSSDEAVDWQRLARATPGNFKETFEASVDVAALRPITTTLSAAGDIRSTQGIPATLHLMRFVDSAQEAKTTARISRTLGSRTSGAFELVGKSRILRATVRYSDEAIGLALAITGAIVSALGLLGSAFGSSLLTRLRRLV